MTTYYLLCTKLTLYIKNPYFSVTIDYGFESITIIRIPMRSYTVATCTIFFKRCKFHDTKFLIVFTLLFLEMLKPSLYINEPYPQLRQNEKMAAMYGWDFLTESY